jgi:signal transduction histidine kinase/DNA-binding response OmpR family regulator
MKKFYILFLLVPVLYFTLLYFPIWWSVGIIAAIMIFIAYRMYTVRVESLNNRNNILDKEVEDLNERLERAVVKEEKTNKEVVQMRQLKQQLLTIISHEIRTPMNGIMGTSLLLEDTPLTKEQKEYISTIRHCGESLLTTINNILVNDLLDYSKLQQEGNQLEYKDFDLRDCVEEVLDMFSGKIGKSGIDLLYEIGPKVPSQIIGDSKRLRQVLINLIENAVKFTRRGEVLLNIQFGEHKSDGQPPQLIFEVKDSGIGIEKDQLKQLFKGLPGKEFQKDTKAEAPGLGLVICKKLVELMGGQIEAKSVVNEGSSFQFTLPMTPSLKAVREHAQQHNMNKLEGKQVLLIDDNSLSRSILLRQLKGWKMEVVPADSGKQALDILTTNKQFDLVITDLLMPGMDGLQFTQAFKASFPAIPVIGLTTEGNENHQRERELFAGIIMKPVRMHIFRDTIIGIFTQSATSITATEQVPGVFAEQYPLRILIAEDNPINQKIAIKILSKLGYEPALANNGKEVMEMVGQDHYDIILMDVQMPEMDGLEATRMIRTCLEIQPVIIAVTANAMQGDRDLCIQAGMDDYMSKPIEMKELLNQLEKWAMVLRERKKLSA